MPSVTFYIKLYYYANASFLIIHQNISDCRTDVVKQFERQCTSSCIYYKYLVTYIVYREIIINII